LEIDRINRPDRALPSGRVSVAAARWIVIISFATGMGLATLAHMLPIAVLALVLLVLYNLVLKKTVLVGNLTVAFLSILPLFYAADLSGREVLIFPAVLVGLIQLSRELVKDVEDMKGDRQSGGNTLPIRFGARVSLGLAFVLNVIMWVILGLSTVLFDYPVWFPLTLLILLVPVTTRWFSRVGTDPEGMHRLQQVLKADMFLGFVALVVLVISEFGG